MLIKYSFILSLGFLASVFSIETIKMIPLIDKLLNRQGVPFIGGICIFMSFLLSCLWGFKFVGHISYYVIGIIVSSTLMLLFGLIDDFREHSIMVKFFVQIMSVYLLVLSGVRTQIVSIGNPANIFITFIWVIGITNAFNLLDVIDGLSAGVSAIISLAFFVISVLTGNITFAILSLGLLGATLGFLIFNFPPARIYMGNSGSHFLGFIFAAIAIVINYATLDRKIALVTPILILGLPILDTLFIILMRLGKRKLPFIKSSDHLALRFLALGYSKRGTLLIMLYLCLFFSTCGVLVSRASNGIGIFIIIFVILVSFLITKRMSAVAIND